MKIKLDEILDYIQPTKYLVSSENYNDEFLTPVLTAGKSFILGYTDENEGIYHASKENPIILFDDFTTDVKWVDFDFKVKSSACKILIPKSKCLNLKFVYYSILGLKFKAESHKRYWISVFSQLLISYPDLSTQNEIVEKLDSFLLAIRKNDSLLNYFDELAFSKYDSLFNGKYENVKIGDKFKTTSGGTPLKSKLEYYRNGNIPWLTSGEINDGIIYKVKNCITKLGLDNSSAKLVPADTIVVAMYGATAGKVGILKTESTTNQAVCCILPSSNYLPFYVYYSLNIKSQEMAGRAGGGAQQNISQGIVRDTCIFDAPLDKQKEFVDFVDLLNEEKRKIKDRTNRLNEAYNLLLDECFGGEE